MPRTRVRFGRLVILSASFLGIIGIVGRGEGQPAAEAASSRVYIVQPGDTLWRIARLQVGPNEDPRPVIEDIREANDLATSALIPGERLVVR